jgi:galactoside O-acetyltransferase
MGDYSHIGPGCIFLGGNGKVKIGKFVNIAPGCKIISASHDYIDGGLSGPTIPEKYSGHSIVSNIVLQDHVLLGCDSIVLPGVIMPKGMATGAFSLVQKRDYQEWQLYIGNPVKKYKMRNWRVILEQAERLLNEFDVGNSSLTF